MNPAKDHRNQGSPSGAGAGANNLHSAASAEGEACKSETLTLCSHCKRAGAVKVGLGVSVCTQPSECPGGRAPVELPQKLKAKRACINVQNRDDCCSQYAMMCWGA